MGKRTEKPATWNGVLGDATPAKVFIRTAFFRDLSKVCSAARDLIDGFEEFLDTHDETTLAIDSPTGRPDLCDVGGEVSFELIALGESDQIPADVRAAKWTIEQFLRALEAKTAGVLPGAAEKLRSVRGGGGTRLRPAGRASAAFR